ncbi:UNVERIFIED_CONTAM: hypothetical protein GTU68_057168 [Idotea baltica]|nr:hypothetical protein [Idotea baltica]
MDVYLKERLKAIKRLVEQPKVQASIEDITATVAHQTGIPLGKLQASETDKWTKIENILRRRIVGQNHVLEKVATVLRRSRAGIREDNKPAAVFFFTGPTGTGKTELAKAIAELLFNDEQALIRFDMSEYMERHSAETLLGAPAGFVGHEEGGLLVNKIRQRPYSVILFDEIEKAHPDVYKIFLQVFDEGHLKDKLDKKGDFTNAILIFTSNVASDWIIKAYEQGKPPTAEALKDKLRNLKDENSRRVFLPEFLGRRMYTHSIAPIDKSIATVS